MTRAACCIVGYNHFFGDSLGDGHFTRDFVYELKTKNPDLDILLIDNYSGKKYPADIGGNVEVIRLNKRVGYAVALNIGLKHLQQKDYDWYICFNNDNWIDPLHPCSLAATLDTLNPRVLYGSGVNNTDKSPTRHWQWSAWLVISREILQAVGYFDEKLEAAFEDFDYEQRAMDAGYELDTAKFRIVHLDEHTRLEDPNYKWRWEAARLWFSEKHGIETEPWLIVKGSKHA
jgi:GT2 family glycosyltransferase